MGVITRLDPDTRAQIAAGEVIERPASIVKELVENALDAHATDIAIAIDESGSRRIQVTDNGIGMDHDDLHVCHEDHSTSKLTHADDLLRVATLGFRGEALSSIKHVGNLTLESRHKKAASGHRLRIEKGTPQDAEPLGMPVGSRITIEHIFEHLPARKSFLKDPRTEWKHIVEAVTSLALAFPEVGFSLSHNGKNVFTLRPESYEDRIQTLLGSHTFEHLIPVEAEGIKGWIGTPQSARKNHPHQYLFINDRHISYPRISRVVKETYGTLLAPHDHVPFIFFLSVPHHHIDINIHPRKETIRLIHENDIYTHIGGHIRKTLEENNLTYITPDSETTSHAGWLENSLAALIHDAAEIWDPRSNSESEPEILTIHNTYLLTQTKKGLLLVDQHAAHERILYDEFKHVFQLKQKELHKLKTPLQIKLSPVEASSLQTLTHVGFEFTQDETTLTIHAVPYAFKHRDIKALIKLLFETDIDSMSDRTLKTLACRTAIKAGDPLREEEKRKLIEKLLATEKAYTCPHGRPTHIEIPLTKIHHLFKR